MTLDALTRAKLTGEEAFSGTDRIVDDAPVGHSMTVLDFWRWSASDLLSNTMRGIVAEYIVAKALGLTDQPREERRAYDLETKDGLKIEVKSATYIQRWARESIGILVAE